MAFPGLMTYVVNGATQRPCRQSRGPERLMRIMTSQLCDRSRERARGAGAPDIPISAARPADRPAEPAWAADITC